MYRTPQREWKPKDITFEEARTMIKAANDALIESGWDSTDFLLKWEQGVITFTEGDY